jgi:hypothetical protein
MGAWLWSAWLQVWPNLAANVIWVPLAWAHHQMMQRQAVEHHEEMKAHVTGAVEAAVRKEA